MFLLGTNSLTGTIPSGWRFSRAWRGISASKPLADGTIPSELALLTRLTGGNLEQLADGHDPLGAGASHNLAEYFFLGVNSLTARSSELALLTSSEYFGLEPAR